MKQRIISLLMSVSLIAGIISADAVSISFDDIDVDQIIETVDAGTPVSIEELETDEIVSNEVVTPSKAADINTENNIESENLVFPDETLLEEAFYTSNNNGISTLAISSNNYTARGYINSPMFAAIGGYDTNKGYRKLTTKESGNYTVESWNQQLDFGYYFEPELADMVARQGNCPNFIQNKYGNGNVVIMFKGVDLYKGEKIQIPVQSKGCQICNSNIQIRYWLHKDGLNIIDGNHEWKQDGQLTNNNIFGNLYSTSYYGQTKGLDVTNSYSLTNNVVEFEIPSTGKYTLEARMSVVSQECGWNKHGISTGGTITILSPDRHINYRYQNTNGSYPNYSVQTYTNTRDNKTYSQAETAEWFAGSVTNTLDSFNATKTGNGTDVNDRSNVYYTMDEDAPSIDIARKQYTVTLNKGNGTAGVMGSGTYYCGASVTINASALSGYSWSKWSGTHNTNTQNYTFTMPASNVVDTANAVPITYKIDYNLNGGTVSGNPATYTIETNTFTLNNPTRTGYTFLGWTGSNGTMPSTNVSIPKGSTGNRNYTANWQANSYTVTLNKGKGIHTVIGNGTYKYGETVTINAALLPGYAWTNWTGTHNTNIQNYTFTMPASNVADTANAVPITYKIDYNLDGGTVSGNPAAYNVETNTFTLNNPAKTGYTFLGWTGSNGTTANTNVSIPKGSTGDKNYTANWRVNQYTVIYIDKTLDGKELGRTTKPADYNTLVKGSDIGNDVSDNAYYLQYKYINDTSATVTTKGAVVYRIFEFCETEAEADLIWNDNDNMDGFRPEKYKLKLKQNGRVIDEVELSSSQINYTFPHLPQYDENGNAYHYSFDVDATDRYEIKFDDNGNLVIEDYQPANFSVRIPKTIVLDGNTGNADYTVSVNGTFYYNDNLTVKPNTSFMMTDRSNISSMQANVSQKKTKFTKEDGVANGTTANGSIQVNRTYFSGLWQGTFNFEIKFIMQN